MPFDFKKEYKEFYLPPAKPVIVIAPKANYIAVRGKGNPNDEGGAYQQAIGVLYAVAYTLKMSYKTDHRIDGFYDYVVPPSRRGISSERSKFFNYSLDSYPELFAYLEKEDYKIADAPRAVLPMA